MGASGKNARKKAKQRAHAAKRSTYQEAIAAGTNTERNRPSSSSRPAPAVKAR